MRRLYFSGNFSLHRPHTQHPNTSSHTQSISRPPHSRHFFLVSSSASTLSPGSNGPAFCLRSFRSSCILSHSAAVMWSGFHSAGGAAAAPCPSPPAAIDLFHGSSSALRNPPLVSVMALKL